MLPASLSATPAKFSLGRTDAVSYPIYAVACTAASHDKTPIDRIY